MSLWLPPRAVALSGLSYVPVALTLSGNEITDAVRTTNTGGDGRTSPDSSAGIWPATTNLAVKNLGTDPLGSATLATDGTFTRTSLGNGWYRVTLTAGTYGIVRILAAAADLTNAETYACSVYSQNRTSTWRLSWCDVATVDITTANPITVSSGVTRSSIAQARATYDPPYRFFDVSTLTVGASIDLRWPQIEHLPVATPYVGVAGGARSAARVQATGGLISAAQGWVALRLRMGWGSAAPLSWATPLSVADNAGRATGRVELYFDQSVNKWTLVRDTAWAGSPNVQSGAVSFARDATVTLIARWTATAIALSVDGGAFTSGAAAQTISTLASTFDIGSVGGASNHLGGDVLWAACGTGTLTDADAATLAALGNTDPRPGQVPAAGRLTGLWTADTATMLKRTL